MPTPGSNEYRRRHAKIRRQLEDQGIPDDEAEERADRAMRETERLHVSAGRSGGGSRQGDPWPDESSPRPRT